MSERVKAIYHNGVLHPLTPLALPENTQVEVIVQAIATPIDLQRQRQAVHEALVAAGLSLPQEKQKIALREGISPSYREEELANLFSMGQSLSEWILEEREEH